MDRHSLTIPLTVVRRAIEAFIAHDVLTLSAALAFYTLLSFAPLMVMVLWATESMQAITQTALLDELAALAGNDVRIAAKAMLTSTGPHQHVGVLAGVIGIGIVVIGATTVFAQLQNTLNVIWDVPARKVSAIRGWLRRRVISAGVLLAIAFVLIVSTIVSSSLGIMLSNVATLWDVANQLISIVILALLFTLLFRYLLESRLPWRESLEGGIASAIFFGIGKWIIGAYLAHGHVSEAYGAASSIVAVLIWAYYSSAVFFFSAELVKAWVHERSARERKGAAPADEVESARGKISHQLPSFRGSESKGVLRELAPVL